MIVLINPNATRSMTDTMLAAAWGLKLPVEIEGWTSVHGPASIQGVEDGKAAVPPLLELVKQASDQGAEAIVIGCFDDTGLLQAQALAACPVLGIGQAAYHMAAMLGGRFSVVTTLDVSVPILEDNIKAYGLTPALGRVRASNVPVLAVEQAEGQVLAEIEAAAREDDISSVVLGCAGMAGLVPQAEAASGLRVIDGVRAAVTVAAGLAR